MKTNKTHFAFLLLLGILSLFGCGPRCDGYVGRFCIAVETAEPIWETLPQYLTTMAYLADYDCKNIEQPDKDKYSYDITIAIYESWAYLDSNAWEHPYASGATSLSNDIIRLRYRSRLSDTALTHEFYQHWVPFNCDLDRDGQPDLNRNSSHTTEWHEYDRSRADILKHTFEE